MDGVPWNDGWRVDRMLKKGEGPFMIAGGCRVLVAASDGETSRLIGSVVSDAG